MDAHSPRIYWPVVKFRNIEGSVTRTGRLVGTGDSENRDLSDMESDSEDTDLDTSPP